MEGEIHCYSPVPSRPPALQLLCDRAVARREVPERPRSPLTGTGGREAGETRKGGEARPLSTSTTHVQLP